MKNLIPVHIAEFYDKNVFEGSMKCISLFADIKGFTQMTNKLMENGKEGAEVLAEAINRVFEPALDIIYKNGGFVTHFAGDAFNALFEKTILDDNSEVHLALSAAWKIKDVFDKINKIETIFGDFEISIKMGMSLGKSSWKILKTEELTSYFYTGEAVDRAANSEKYSQTNEIVIDSHLKNWITNDIEVSLEEINKNHFSITDIPKIKIGSANIKRSPISIQEKFYPRQLIDTDSLGEFRDVVSCFVSFESHTEFEKEIEKIMVLTQKYKGYFNRISFGDKGGFMLIIFGAPKTEENLFVRACSFAVKVQEIQSLNLRIGITFGKAFAGFIGSSFRAEYTVQGGKVNLSARFMTRADMWETFLDEETAKKVSSEFQIKHIFDEKFKGFKEKIPVYSLVKKIEKPKSEKKYSDNFAGRKEELDYLKKETELFLESGNGKGIFIDGNPGIGKSRLAAELLNILKDKDINSYVLPADQILQEAFNPFKQFFRSYFEFSEERNEEENKNLFQTKYIDFASNIESEDIKKEAFRTESFIAGLCGLRFEGSLFDTLEPEIKYENMIISAVNFLRGLSEKENLFLIAEDLQWFDSGSKDILRRFFKKDTNCLALFLCRFNDDGSVISLDIKNFPVKRLALKELDKESVNEIIFQIIGDRRVPEETLNVIQEKSLGNPFFAEQISLFLRENKMLNHDYKIAEKDFEIPSDINTVIISRVDRLSSELKHIVKTASVLGREFSIHILSNMLRSLEGLNISDIEDYIEKGEKESIWTVISELKALFKHIIIKDAVYNMQLKNRLRLLHKFAAETIAELYKESLEKYYYDIVFHYGRAYQKKDDLQVKDNYIKFLELSEKKARKNYENLKAEEFNKKLLKLYDDQTKKLSVFLRLGSILTNLGKNSEGLSYLRKGLKLSEELQDINNQALFKTSLGFDLVEIGKVKEALPYLESAASMEVSDSEILAEIKGNLGFAYSSIGRKEEAVSYLLEAVETAKKIKKTKLLIKSYGNLAIAYHRQGNLEEAERLNRECLKTAERENEKKAVMLTLNNIGNIKYEKGELKETIELYSKQIEIAREIGSANGLAIGYSNLANSYTALRRLDEAEVIYSRQIEIDKEQENFGRLTKTYINYGVLYAMQSKFKEASEKFEEADRLCSETENEMDRQYVLLNLSKLYATLGDLEKSEKTVLEAADISKRLGIKQVTALAYQAYGDILDLKHETRKAVKAFNSAVKYAKKSGYLKILGDIIYKKSLDLVRLGMLDEAENNIYQAVQIAEKLEDRDTLFRSRGLIAELQFYRLEFSEKKKSAAELLIEIRDKSEDDDFRADMNSRIYIMLRTWDEASKYFDVDEFKKSALEYYESKFKETGDFDLKFKIEELE